MGNEATAVQAEKAPIRLDVGCGKSKKEGFTGVDRRAFDGVDIVHDLRSYPWPFEDDSVDEVHCSHFIEHLENSERHPDRVRFVNELYRIMKPGAKATIIAPHWASCRAYGDFTHAWPALNEMWFYYLSRDWRLANAPDNDVSWNPDGYTCNFAATWGYSMHQSWLVRDPQYQQFALQNFKEAAQDCIATLTKA